MVRDVESSGTRGTESSGARGTTYRVVGQSAARSVSDRPAPLEGTQRVAAFVVGVHAVDLDPPLA